VSERLIADSRPASSVDALSEMADAAAASP